MKKILFLIPFLLLLSCSDKGECPPSQPGEPDADVTYIDNEDPAEVDFADEEIGDKNARASVSTGYYFQTTNEDNDENMDRLFQMDDWFLGPTLPEVQVVLPKRTTPAATYRRVIWKGNQFVKYKAMKNGWHFIKLLQYLNGEYLDTPLSLVIEVKAGEKRLVEWDIMSTSVQHYPLEATRLIRTVYAPELPLNGGHYKVWLSANPSNLDYKNFVLRYNDTNDDDAYSWMNMTDATYWRPSQTTSAGKSVAIRVPRTGNLVLWSNYGPENAEKVIGKCVDLTVKKGVSIKFKPAKVAN